MTSRAKRWNAWRLVPALLVGIMLVFTMMIFGRSGLLQHIEGNLLDLRFRLRQAQPTAVPITLVLIDDRDIATVGRWPWSRDVHARLLNRIGAAQPRVIGVDLLFTESQTSRADADLAAAIARNAPVIMPFAIDMATARSPLPPDRARPALPAGVAGQAYPRSRGPEPDYLPDAERLRLPIDVLREGANLAHITIVPDRVGSVRTDYPVLRYGDDYFPSLSLEAARIFLGLTRQEVVIERRTGIRLGQRLIPTDAGLRMQVNFRPPFSFNAVSASDVLDDHVAPELLRDRIVLIGANAPGIGDTLSSPYTPTLPGVERHAMLVASMLDGELLVRNDGTLAMDVAVILACSLLVGLAAGRGVAAMAVTAMALLLVVPVFNVLAFLSLNLCLNLLMPEASILLTLAVMLAGQQITGAATLARWQDQARRDPLTGLHNRAGLFDWLQQATAPRGRGNGRHKGPGLLVFMADLDGFKLVNDTHGHAAGDRLLHEVAARMAHTVRPTDLVARLGGDEFMLVFSVDAPGNTVGNTVGNTAGNTADGTAAVQRVFDAVCAPYVIGGTPMRVGLSLGGARWPQDDADIARVINLADAALYQAKREGRGRITLHRPAAQVAETA